MWHITNGYHCAGPYNIKILVKGINFTAYWLPFSVLVAIKRCHTASKFLLNPLSLHARMLLAVYAFPQVGRVAVVF